MVVCTRWHKRRDAGEEGRKGSLQQGCPRLSSVSDGDGGGGHRFRRSVQRGTHSKPTSGHVEVYGCVYFSHSRYPYRRNLLPSRYVCVIASSSALIHHPSIGASHAWRKRHAAAAVAGEGAICRSGFAASRSPLRPLTQVSSPNLA